MAGSNSSTWSKYSVTVAQFGQFSRSGAYQKAKYWQEAAQKGFWRDGKVKFWDRLQIVTGQWEKASA